jgi:hypothetical protein
MGPRHYVLEDDSLEVTTCDAHEIKERIVAVLRQVLKNSERPRNIGVPIAEKNSFLDECPYPYKRRPLRKDKIEIPRMDAFSKPSGRHWKLKTRVS